MGKDRKIREESDRPREPQDSLLLSRGGREGGRGEEQRFLTGGTQLLDLLPPLLSPFSPLPESLL